MYCTTLVCLMSQTVQPHLYVLILLLSDSSTCPSCVFHMIRACWPARYLAICECQLIELRTRFHSKAVIMVYGRTCVAKVTGSGDQWSVGRPTEALEKLWYGSSHAKVKSSQELVVIDMDARWEILHRSQGSQVPWTNQIESGKKMAYPAGNSSSSVPLIRRLDGQI